MKPVIWMVAGSMASWFAITVFLDEHTGWEILCGMFGPLVAVAGSWIAAKWVYERNPVDLTSMMITAFAAKLVFFGGYVAVMLKVLGLHPVPFMVSFTGYFIALYFMEALFLRRLFSRGSQ
jgi:uncharacterized membrane protein YeaQ/YmgE (transglycosylase-associated protein family)